MTATDSSTPTHLTAKASLSITVAAGLVLKAVPTPAYGQVGVAYPGISPGIDRRDRSDHLDGHRRQPPVRSEPQPGDRGDHRDTDERRDLPVHTDRHRLGRTDRADRLGQPVDHRAGPTAGHHHHLAAARRGRLLLHADGPAQRTGGYSAVTWAVTGGSLPPGHLT